MATPRIRFAELDQLIDELRNVTDPPLSVDLSSSKVRPPGVWVKVRAIRAEQLAGVTYRCTFYCMVADIEPRDAMRELETLHNLMAPLIDSLGGPTGDTEAVTVLTPDNARLPALATPVDIDTDS